MAGSVEPKTPPKQGRRFFRKKVVIPTEHGSWSWMLVPYFVGLAVAGQMNLEAALVLIGGMSGFMVRQPMTVWMRARDGRGRKRDGPLAAAWALGFGLVALLCLIGLLILGRPEQLGRKYSLLLIPIAVIFVLYLAGARQKRSGLRKLWMELAGAAGLAAMAPAAYIAATGQLDETAWALWGLMVGQNVLGVLYVRLRIADTHDRPVARPAILWSHVLVLVAVIAAAFLGAVPWLTIVPFIGFLLRAGWAVAKKRPVANIKRFGFIEIGVEIVSGVIIVIGFSLA
jgi:hypothetical protein